MPQGTGEVGKKQDILGIVPYVRIHDYVLSVSDIISLELDCSEFLPTMVLRVKTPSTTLSDTNKIDDGDLVSIGIRTDLKVFKPISVDFLVTSVQSSSQGLGQNEGDGLYEYYIRGRLNIPNIDTEDIRFSYQGYAEEALMEGAKRVGLGYVENDNPRTPSIKKETWTCYNNVLEFFQNVTRHMWAGKDSFFDSWIDLYMNLVNVNVNDMLGRKIEDDGVMDFTKYRSIIATAGNDGKYVHNDLDTMDKYKDNKLFTNDKQAQTSVWFVNSYYLENNATKISKKYGIQKNFNIYIQNNGLGQSENDSKYEVGIGVYYNQEKLQLGYVILNGPAEADKNYKKADNGNWKNQNIKTEAPVIMPVQSDGDEDDRQNAKNNKKASGNFSKEYLIAPEHNEINLAELEKQNVIIRTTGFNNGFARGEKVPCVLYRQSDTKYLNPVRELPDTTYLLDAICSGWFYVKAVKYIYTPRTNTSNSISDWVTETTLTRREWFPPEPTTTSAGAGDGGGNGGGNSSQSNSPSPTSIASGGTQLNDVTNGAINAATENPTPNTKPEDSFPQNTNGTQTESSPMEKEVQQNIDNQERNADALNALDANDKTAEVLDNAEKTTNKANDAVEGNQ